MAGWNTVSSRKAAALVALILVSMPAFARAQAPQTCALLPPAEPIEDEGSPERTAREEVVRQLEQRDVTVLPPAEARLRMLGQEFRDCAQIDCAAAVNRFLGTAFAVRLETLWSQTRLSEISVAIIGLEDGESYGGQAEVDTDVASATRRAFRNAWDRWTASRQGQLVVRSTPESALVQLDGAHIGQTPLTRLIPAGEHAYRVSLDEHEPHTGRFTIGSGQQRELQIALERSPALGVDPEPTGAIATPPRESYRPLHALIGPAVLLAGGLGFLTLDIVALGELGCAREVAGTCVEERVLDELPFTLFAVGAGLLISTAVVWFFTVDDDTSPSRPLSIQPGRAYRANENIEGETDAPPDDSSADAPSSEAGAPSSEAGAPSSEPNAGAADESGDTSYRVPGNRIGFGVGLGSIGLMGTF